MVGRQGESAGCFAIGFLARALLFFSYLGELRAEGTLTMLIFSHHQVEDGEVLPFDLALCSHNHGRV